MHLVYQLLIVILALLIYGQLKAFAPTIAK